MALEAQIEEYHEKNASKNDVFFACVFKWILESFGEGFGRVLGGFWEVLGVSWATFLRLFSRLCCQEGSRGSKRRPRGLLGSISEGFRRALGKVWEAKMVKISRFLVFFGYAFRDFDFDRILFDF